MTATMEQLAEQLGNALKQRAWKVAVAESCTAGGLAYAITMIPGSSDWFDRGFVTYSNASKEELLGVHSLTLNTFGAVSEQTAREMAEGTLKHSQAHISIAITGIAGPDGGSAAKPIGTVWFAYAIRHQDTQTFVHIFSGDRKAVREQAIKKALEKILDWVMSLR